MIELYEGIPGSGKSFWTIKEKLLPAIQDGRKIYVYVDGVYCDRIAWFLDKPVAELTEQLVIMKDPLEVLQIHKTVEPGSLVILDEAQNVFRAMERVDKALLRWLETHRHYGVDILMCAQDYMQMAQGVTRLVESTTKFKRLSVFGFDRRSQGIVRGTPADTETIRKFVFKYDPRYYSFYASYAAAAIRERKRPHTIYQSATAITGLVAACFSMSVFIWRPWTSLGAPAEAQKITEQKKPVVASVSTAPPATQSVGETAPVEIRILGQWAVDEGPIEARTWRYMLASGEVLTASDIAARFGVSVTEVVEGPFMRLKGPGVVYGPGGD